MKRVTSLLCCVALIAAAPIDVTGSKSPVADAAQNGDHDTLRTLLRDGADVNHAQGDGMTALHWAAVSEDVVMAEMLLYAGANVRAATRIGGYTPLFLAAKRGSAPLLELLIDAGADVNRPTRSGATPLMMAAASGASSRRETTGASRRPGRSGISAR